jgi:hypothetical protein
VLQKKEKKKKRKKTKKKEKERKRKRSGNCRDNAYFCTKVILDITDFCNVIMFSLIMLLNF